MTIRLRTGYSFRSAVGRIDDVQSRLLEIGQKFAPITDTASTFGYVKWRKAALKNNLKPIFGVELAVTTSINEKKPSVDYWTFIAKDSLKPIHELVQTATDQFRYQPLLTRDQALECVGEVFVIMGYRTRFDEITCREGLYVGLGPSLTLGQFRRAKAADHPFVFASDNRYPRQGQMGLYETICGRNTATQSYPQWIMSKEEWIEDCIDRIGVPEDEIDICLNRTNAIVDASTAELIPAEMVKPEKAKSLRDMCIEGAAELSCDLTRPDYQARLDRELSLIEEKKFEDYFYIVADICQWARKRMIVGPARGSSCSSLVCYLLKITSIDPIPFGLIFERFIDINRNDLPDIDIDFPEDRRDEVFAYIGEKYGQSKVARLGTVAMYQPKSALKEAAGALDIEPWLLNPVVDSIINRSSGDARALQSTEDTFKDTAAGREFIEKYPEIMVAAQMEGHPRHSSSHAAGIVITDKPINEYVAYDKRTGAIMCDKKDAEELNLLKIDALGLTQLSTFEYALKLAGLPMDHLFGIPLDDPMAFDILNQQRYAGIFQFNGLAMQMTTSMVKVREFNDIVAITALARPGPLNTGGTNRWIAIKNEQMPESYPHPLFEPFLKKTLGVVAYQEQVMNIGREIGDLSWEDVTALRKAMSRSLGAEFFNQYGDRWKNGARAKGISEETIEKVWDDLCLSGDTVLINPFPSKGDYRYITLKQLYDRGGIGPTDKTKARRVRTRQSLLMWDGESLKPHENWGVTYSGKRQTYKLTTESGNVIHATEEHKFLQKDGSYCKLKDMIGREAYVMIDVGGIPTKRKMKKGTGSGGHNWWHKLKAGVPNYAENRRWLRANFTKCQQCDVEPYEETHHIDANHENHAIDNLMPVCRKCHKKLHAAMNNGLYPAPWQKGRMIAPDHVISIEPHKVEDVYDIHMPSPHHNFLADGIIVHNCAYGSWAFNESHAVAYGLVSYWCCYMKAHYPVEFAAATLSYTAKPESQIKLLRELANEGIEYVPADREYSTDKWNVKKDGNRAVLVGPLSNIIGCGPKMQAQIIRCRETNEPLPTSVQKRLSKIKTNIDSLWPVRDNIKRLREKDEELDMILRSDPKPIVDLQPNGKAYSVVVHAIIEEIKPKNENEPLAVAKRGGKLLKEPTDYLNLRISDDTDIIFAKVNCFDFEELGRPIIELGKAKKAIYAFRGTVPKSFRMLSIKLVQYIGDME